MMVGQTNISSSAYPVGAIYTSSSNIDPSMLFGGTWTSFINGPKRIHIGSAVLYTGTSGSGATTKANLLGAYDYDLINGIFSNQTIPNGFHKEYRLIGQISTGSGNSLTLFLNNITTSTRGTWSAAHYRTIIASDYFKEEDITLETTMGYSAKGVNLKYTNSASGDWRIYGVSLAGFIASDYDFYTWERIA